MKISYKKNVFHIEVEYSETDTYVSGDNVFTAKEKFLDRMSKVFDDTIRKHLSLLEE